jgi:L-threonylcarbamoyladenylate synthase
VVVPTETVYGITCALDEAAVERLLVAKGRPASKGITLLIDDLVDAAGLVDAPAGAADLAARWWPGPLSLVLPLRAEVDLPDAVTGGSRSVGLRVPDQPLVRALARELGPLPLTSANRTGEPDARSADEARTSLGEAVAVFIDGGPSPGGRPSTVVALAADGTGRILRPGPIDAASLGLPDPGR